MSTSQRPSAITQLCVFIALTMLIVAMFFARTPYLYGYFAAWLMTLGIPVGATVLLYVHALTGGRWGDAVTPVLSTAAATMPMHGLLLVPVLLQPQTVFPWAATPLAAPAADVAHLYLNVPGFVGRAIVIVLLWSALSLFAIRGRTSARLAAIALVVYGITLTIAAIDWIMALDPTWTSTAIGWTFAAALVLMALAWTAVWLHPSDAINDVAQMSFAAVLVDLYLWIMQYLIMWADNMPDKAAWFVTRGDAPWVWMIVAAVIVGAAVPCGLLLTAAGRHSRIRVAAAGVAIIVGLTLLTGWEVLPAAEAPVSAIIAYGLATAAFLGVHMLAIGARWPWQSAVARTADD